MLSCQCPQKHILSPLALWDFKVSCSHHRETSLPFFQHFWCRTTCSVVLQQLEERESGEMERCGFCDTLLPFPFVSCFFVYLERQGRDKAGLMWWKAVLLWGNKSYNPKGRLEQKWKIGVLFPKIERGHVLRAIIKWVLAVREVVCLVTHQYFPKILRKEWSQNISLKWQHRTRRNSQWINQSQHLFCLTQRWWVVQSSHSPWLWEAFIGL